jgi:hypothetical protein
LASLGVTMICRTPVCFIGRRALTAAGRAPANRMGIPMAGNGALQPMAAGFAAGSDLTGTSGAGIARSCPKPAVVRACLGRYRLRDAGRGTHGGLGPSTRFRWTAGV